ncbi:MAG: hypothetical protein KDD44_03445, partial [Bdellovibrionales bacterium]|nr:hypothetical protein [Bdellovibrionales bacterium]
IKDLTCLLRDRAQSLQLVLYLGIAAFYIIIFGFMSAAVNLLPVANQLWWAFLGWINVLLSGLILNAVMTRLVYPSISLEGKALWILVIAPLDIRQLVRAKFWCWLPMTLLVSLSLITAGSFAIGLSAEVKVYTVLIAIAMSIGFTGLAIGLGAIFAKFEWEAPNQISAGIGTLVLLPLGLLLAAVSSIPAGIMIALVQVPAIQNYLGYPLALSLLVLSTLLIFLINWSVASWSCRAGSNRLLQKIT